MNTDAMAKKIFGQTRDEAIASGTCIKCKQKATPRCYTQAGRREFIISGMCEICFDKLFQDGTRGPEESQEKSNDARDTEKQV